MAKRVIINKNVWAALAISLGLTILTVAHLDQKAKQPVNNAELTNGIN